MTLATLFPPLENLSKDKYVAQIREQKELFENLVLVAQAAVEIPTIYEALQNILHTVARINGAERGSIFMVDASGQVTHSVLMREQVSQPAKRSLVHHVMRHGLAGWVTKHKEPALIHDTKHDPRWLDLAGAPYIVRSALAVPILTGPDRLLQGIVMFFHSQPRHFTLHHQKFLQAATEHMALAVRNAQYYDANIRLLNRQVLLYSVLTSVSIETELDTVAQAAIDTLSGLSAWHDLAILLAGDTPGTWKITASNGHLASLSGVLLPETPNILWKALHSGASQRLARAERDTPPFQPLMASEMVVPFRRRGELLGCMYIGSADENAFELEDLQLAESLVEAIILALDNARHLTNERLLSEQLAGARSQLDSLLHQFLPSAVADQMIANPAAIQPGGERQLVTVLFADLRGFTRWAEDKPPEEVMKMLNQKLALGAGAVLAEGGTLDKYMGDALMAVFNTPLTQPDHASRAVRVAQAIRAAVCSFPGDDLHFSIGINTGTVVAGYVGTQAMLNYTVLGDAVNQAKRLQEMAKPGQILMSETTYALAPSVLAQEIGDIQLRGREQSVKVFEVVALRPRTGG